MDGHEYVAGNLIYSPRAPCYKCLCDEKFDNTTEIAKNPSCKPVDCGIQLHQFSYIQLGCIPVYFDDCLCCPFEFRCRMHEFPIYLSEIRIYQLDLRWITQKKIDFHFSKSIGYNYSGCNKSKKFWSCLPIWKSNIEYWWHHQNRRSMFGMQMWSTTICSMHPNNNNWKMPLENGSRNDVFSSTPPKLSIFILKLQILYNNSFFCINKSIKMSHK